MFAEVVAQAKAMQAALKNSSADIQTNFKKTGDAADDMSTRTTSAMKKAGSSVDDTKKKVDNATPSFLAMHKGIVAIAGAALTMGGPALTTLGGAAIGLSGALIGAGAGLGIFALAAKPVITNIAAASQAQTAYNQAVQAGNTQQQVAALKKLQEAYGNMTPAQIAAATAMTNFKQTYQNWSNSLATPISKDLTMGMNALANILPRLTPVVQSVAGAVGQLIGNFAAFAQSTGFGSFLSMIQKVAGPALTDFGVIIQNLMATLGNLFNAAWPLISAVLNGLVNLSSDLASMKFGEILAPLIAAFQQDAPLITGLLHAIIDVVHTLFSALAPIGQALAGVLGDALHAVIPLIETLGSVLSAIMPTVGKLVSVLVNSLGSILVNLVPVFNPLIKLIGQLAQIVGGALISSLQIVAPLIEGLIPVVGAFINAFVTAFSPMANVVAQLVNDFTPLTYLFAPIAKALAQLAPVFAALGTIVGQLLAPALQILGQIFNIINRAIESALLPALLKIVTMAITNLLPAIESLMPVFTLLAQVVGEILPLALQILTPLIKILAVEWSTLVPLIAEIIKIGVVPFLMTIVKVVQALLPIIAHLAETLGNSLLEVFKALLPVLPVLVNALLQILTAVLPLVPALGELLVALLPLLEPIIKLAALILSLVADGLVVLVRYVLDILTPVLTGLITAVVAVLTSWGTVWDALKTATLAVWDALVTAWNAVADALSTAWNVFYNVVSEVFDAIGNYITTAWAHIWQTLTDAWNDFYNFIKPAVDLFNTVISAVFDAISDALTKIWGAIWPVLKVAWDFFSGIITGAWNDFTGVVSTAWGAITSAVSAVWGPLWDGLKTAWDTFVGVIETAWSTFSTEVSTIWGGIVNGIADVWGGLETAAQSVWDNVKGFFVGGINGVIGIINDFVHAINKLTGFFSIPPIPDIPTVGGGGGSIGNAKGQTASGATASQATRLATGGMITRGPTYLVGEGDPRYPEAVIPTDPRYRSNAMSLLSWVTSSLGMASGGIIGMQSGGKHHAWYDPRSYIQDASNVVHDVANTAAKAALTPIKAIADVAASALPKPWSGTAHHIINTIYNGLLGKTKAQGGAANLPASMVPTGDHLTLIDQALQMAGVAANTANEAAVNLIATNESGWNANSINLWDSNAAAGDPSRGLMQTIMSTFMAYALPGFNTNIYDPLSNLIAGIRYAVSRYGSLGNVPGVKAVAGGGKYVGYDEGGYLMPGLTLAYNGTGKPEAVTSPTGAGPHGGPHITVDYHPTFTVTGSTDQELLTNMQKVVDKSLEELTQQMIARYMPA